MVWSWLQCFQSYFWEMRPILALPISGNPLEWKKGEQEQTVMTTLPCPRHYAKLLHQLIFYLISSLPTLTAPGWNAMVHLWFLVKEDFLMVKKIKYPSPSSCLLYGRENLPLQKAPRSFSVQSPEMWKIWEIHKNIHWCGENSGNGFFYFLSNCSYSPIF